MMANTFDDAGERPPFEEIAQEVLTRSSSLNSRSAHAGQ
jgi:hypothetical protein